jgi:SPARK
MRVASPSPLLLLALIAYIVFPAMTTPDMVITPDSYSADEQPLNPGDLASNTVPAVPVAQAKNGTCHLDLSNELFGGVSAACGGGRGAAASLDRGRCCPVLAAWLFAAHARSALQVSDPPADVSSYGEDGPMVPYDNQKCVDALQVMILHCRIFFLKKLHCQIILFYIFAH